MNTKHFFIALLFVTFQLVNGQNKTKSTDETEMHIQLLEDFYTEYISGNHNARDVCFLKLYCTEKLINKLNEFSFEYDPFLFAQDVWKGVLNYLKVEKYGVQENVYEVSFHYLNQNDSDRTRIRLEVANTTEGFINDIISVYDSEKGLAFPLGRQ